MTAFTWTPETIAKLDKPQINALRENARRLGAADVVAFCEEELVRRLPAKSERKTTRIKSSSGDYVAGYHFVCGGRRGVIDHDDGTFWTGSWVVAQGNVEESLKYGAYVALHETKNENSYLQGEILEYRLRERDMVDKENVGVEFRCKYSNDSKMWVGGGSGEKGYNWQPLVRNQSA